MRSEFELIVKILTPFLIITFAFLSYFFITQYDMEKENLIINEIKMLKEIKVEIYMKASENKINKIKELNKEKGVKACIFSKNGNLIYFDNQSLCNTPKVENLYNGIVYIYENLQNMNKNSKTELDNAKILLYGKDMASKILYLQLMILGKILVCLTYTWNLLCIRGLATFASCL